MIGRLMRSATTGFVFGSTLPEPDVPRFGDYVCVPAQHGRIDVIGLVYNIVVQDDAFVRPLVAAGELPEEYILDQRRNRQVPVEVSVLAVGYRLNEPDGDLRGYQQGLPPQPPVTLDVIKACTRDEIEAFTERLDFLRLVLEAVDAPGEELAVVAIKRAAMARLVNDRPLFLREAGRQIARLLPRDLPRLERILRRLA